MVDGASLRDASPLHPVRGAPGRWRCINRCRNWPRDAKTQAEIISRLHLHHNTVRKYLRMLTFVAHYCHPSPSPVEPYRTYLEERGPQGEVMITTLWHELQEQGFTGSYKSVWAFVRHWPLPAGMTPASSSSSAAPATRRNAPATRTPWQVKWLLLRQPEDLNAADVAYRQALFDLSPHLASLATLGQDFVRLIHERQSEALLPWLERAKGCPYEELRRFAASAWRKSLERFKPPSPNLGVPGRSKDRSPDSSCSNARCMDVPTSICCVCACCMWLNLLQQHLAAHFALAEACISIHLLTAVILGKNTHRHDFSSALLPHIFSFLQALHYPNQQKLGRASRLVNHTRIPWERLGQHS